MIAKTSANERFPRGTPVAERRLRRGTVETLHSRAETPKGPTVVGPFDFSDVLVAGAGYAEYYTAPETHWIDLK